MRCSLPLPFLTPDGEIGNVIPYSEDERKLMVCKENGIFKFDLDTKAETLLAEMLDKDSPVRTRINDGKCDVMGRLWAGKGTPSTTFSHLQSQRDAITLTMVAPLFTMARKVSTVVRFNVTSPSSKFFECFEALFSCLLWESPASSDFRGDAHIRTINVIIAQTFCKLLNL